jgi:hypothetical protein
MQDANAILLDAAPLIETNGLNLDEARDVILRDMLGEQPLPLGDSPHPQRGADPPRQRFPVSGMAAKTAANYNWIADVATPLTTSS